MLESVHGVDMVVCDSDGAIVEAWGQADLAVFPRSAIKALQAIPLIESGAADAFGFSARQLALACSSHNGEPIHVEAARQGLAQAGVSETCLECGAQLPNRSQDQADLVRAGIQASAIHNNCSGKHVGFLAVAKHQGMDVRGYIDIAHPLQKEIASVLTQTTGHEHSVKTFGIDGCSIPTYPLPLRNLATAFARFGVGQADGALRAQAMGRLRDACMAHPEMVAGTDRNCTKLMQVLPGQVFAKVGAEGVYTAAFPTIGLGVAMKARDGSFRAVEVAVNSLAERLLTADIPSLTRPALKNWNGIEVGVVRLSTEV